MNPSAPFNPFRVPASTAACHEQHQHWQHIIRQQEDEIRQLRALLLDVMEQHNCRSLHHDAIDYYRDLNHLQTKLERLHRDFICEGVTCASTTEKESCADARFNLSATIERHTAVLIGEFSRIKDGCLQFLSGMMSLNLL